jgi:hypothetical protein
MGAKAGNMRLAGDASARLREAASQGIQERREAMKDRLEAHRQNHDHERSGMYHRRNDEDKESMSDGGRFDARNKFKGGPPMISNPMSPVGNPISPSVANPVSMPRQSSGPAF